MGLSDPAFWIQLFVEFAAAASGVFIAFYLENKRREKEQREHNETRTLRLLDDIQGELKRNAGHLEGKGHRMITDVWDSGISSGLIQLLDSRKLRRLSNLYHAIKVNAEEARICRQAGEEFRSIPESERDNSSVAYKRWLQLSEMGRVREADLKRRIETILQEEDFWK